ncbi:MAG: PAS and helix-turn-helix domain-containing protein [Nitrospirae bacterium]|nr:PAS and helix-turn-helix domain-containing protein [Nitrospirota bacterium]
MLNQNVKGATSSFSYQTPEGVVEMDATGKILSANPSAEEILGYASGEMAGKPCYETCQGHDLSGNRYCFPNCTVMEMAKRNEPVQNFDIQVLTRAGKKIWLNVTTLLESNGSYTVDSRIIHIFRKVPSPMGAEYFFRQIPDLNETLNKSQGLLQSYQKTNHVGSVAKQFGLSPRETEVFKLLTEGHGTHEMGGMLKLKTTTVRTHIQRILKKLNVHSMLEAVAMALGKNPSEFSRGE